MNNDDYKKPNLATDLPPPKQLSAEELKQAVEEGRKLSEQIWKPKKPGKYDIKTNCRNLRGELIKKHCLVCTGQLEIVYEVVNTRPDFIGPGATTWQQRCTRCSQCGLKYDLTGIK